MGNQTVEQEKRGQTLPTSVTNNLYRRVRQLGRVISKIQSPGRPTLVLLVTDDTRNLKKLPRCRYQKSLRHYLTREALPVEANYRNLDSIVGGGTRPTLDELHDDTSDWNKSYHVSTPIPFVTPVVMVLYSL